MIGHVKPKQIVVGIFCRAYESFKLLLGSIGEVEFKRNQKLFKNKDAGSISCFGLNTATIYFVGGIYLQFLTCHIRTYGRNKSTVLIYHVMRSFYTLLNEHFLFSVLYTD